MNEEVTAVERVLQQFAARFDLKIPEHLRTATLHVFEKVISELSSLLRREEERSFAISLLSLLIHFYCRVKCRGVDGVLAELSNKKICKSLYEPLARSLREQLKLV